MSTVYVVQEAMRFDNAQGKLVPRFPDLAQEAAKLGQVKYLLSPSAAPWKSESVIADLWKGLETYSNNDFLLLVGNPILIGFAVAVACEINEGRVKCLQWSGKDGKYISVEAQVFLPDEESDSAMLSPA